MSQDIFQRRMDNITERLKGIISIHDDICVFGKTQQEHDENLLQLMKVAQKCMVLYSTATNAKLANSKYPFMEQFF